MPTTTKMGIVYPSSTDLVKDGATAMGTISTTVDSKTGLVFISTTSFSGVAGVSLPANTFTSSFRNYRIIVEATGASASGGHSFRLRASGADNTTANYNYQNLESLSSTTTSQRSTGQTNWNLFSITANRTFFIIDLIAPQAAETTLGYIDSAYNASSTTLGIENYVLSFTASTQFDSLSLNSSGANLSGVYSVYGYNN
jgi:hypothetical protein